MVTTKQKRELKELMKNIKAAKENDMSEEEIKRRTKELYTYLQNEGLIDRFYE